MSFVKIYLFFLKAGFLIVGRKTEKCIESVFGEKFLYAKTIHFLIVGFLSIIIYDLILYGQQIFNVTIGYILGRHLECIIVYIVMNISLSFPASAIVKLLYKNKL